jgi:Protein of unknown function (DUF3102)
MLAKAEISAAELQEVAGRIRILRQKATEHAVEIGRELLRVKENLPHGRFVRWVEKECEFKIRTAQDLMRLARELESHENLAALMLPSTLRIYLSKNTPAEVRQQVKAKLEGGERVSRNDLHSAIAEAKARQAKSKPGAQASGQPHTFATDLLTAGEAGRHSEIDRARKIADLLIQRLDKNDYQYIMDGMNWGIWNRVLVWLRAGRVASCDQLNRADVSELSRSAVATAN